MNTKHKILSAAVGAALGAAAMQAQADAVWLPYFTVGNGTYTFLTLRHDGGVGPVPFSVPDVNGVQVPDVPFNQTPIHYHWYYKTDPANNLLACNKLNQIGGMSHWDLIQQSVINDIDLPTLFGDQSAHRYLSVSPTIGMMIVQDDSPEGSLGADALVVDFNLNLYAAYKGINQFFPINTPIVDITAPGLNPNPVTNFTVPFSVHWTYDLSWYPIPLVDTAWWVAVGGAAMTTQAAGNWRGTVAMLQGFGGVLDRDENFYSGARAHVVTCYDWVTLADLLDPGQIANVQLGGWSWETTVPPAVIPNTLPAVANPAFPVGGASVWKFQSVDLGVVTGPSAFFGPENAWPNLPY